MGVSVLFVVHQNICLVSISSQLFHTMKPFFGVLAAAAMGYAAPAADPQLLQSGLPAGPLTPAWGDGVLTPRGVRPLHLEGFSEDVNQDGFVDPIGAAVAPVAVAAPAVHAVAAPAVTYAGYALPAVKPVEVKVPVVTYAAAPALAHPVHYAAPLVHQVVHQPVATHTYTVPHVLGAGAPILGGLPVIAAAKPAEAEAEAAV